MTPKKTAAAVAEQTKLVRGSLESYRLLYCHHCSSFGSLTLPQQQVVRLDAASVLLVRQASEGSGMPRLPTQKGPARGLAKPPGSP
jgi:hypothetical protein